MFTHTHIYAHSNALNPKAQKLPKMQAKPIPNTPTYINSPPISPPVLQVSSTPTITKPPSISSPKNDAVVPTRIRTRAPIPVPIRPFIEHDDKIAAQWDYQFLFMSQRSETIQPVNLLVVDGAIPTDFPSGAYYLTGPGILEDDHGSTVHPLDGHGYLRAFTFNHVTKEVNYMAKYIKTEAQLEEYDSENKAWRFTHRGPFSVLKSGKKIGNTKVMKNVANTSVLKWGEKLLCMWEGGDPYEIESGSLDTIGKFNMMDGCDLIDHDEENHDGGVWEVTARLLKPILYGIFKMPPKRLLSHYKVDSSRDRLLTVSCNAEDMLLPRSNFTFTEYDSNFNVVQKQDFRIPDHLMIHDWGFTDTHYIVFANRIKLDILGSMEALCGTSPMISALTVNPSKSTSPIYLLPRFPDKPEGKKRDWRIAVEAPSQLWLLHVGNAFEVRQPHGNLDIQIQASACSYHWFNFRKLFGYNWRTTQLDPSTMNIKGGNELLPHLVKVYIKLDSDYNCHECVVKPIKKWKKSSDFPAINLAFSGKQNKYLYAATTLGSRKTLPSFPFDTVVKLDIVNDSAQTWTTGTRGFVGEPIFVPKGHKEDDGYLLVIEYAASMERCYLVILNPKEIGTKHALVARLEIPSHLKFPLGFHGFWAAS